MARRIFVLFFVSIMRIIYLIHLRLHNVIGEILNIYQKSWTSPLNFTYFPFGNQKDYSQDVFFKIFIIMSSQDINSRITNIGNKEWGYIY
jgi:hypothetical protein